MKATAGRTKDRGVFRDPAFMANRETPVHRWVPWIAGFSKHFVQDALTRHLPGPEAGVVLDPFAGVGTTLVEADLAGHEAVGFEINPYAAFAARAKLGAHRLEPEGLKAASIADFVAFMEGSASAQAAHLRNRRPPPSARGRRSTARRSSARSCRPSISRRRWSRPSPSCFASPSPRPWWATPTTPTSRVWGARPPSGGPRSRMTTWPAPSAKLRQMADDADWYRGDAREPRA